MVSPLQVDQRETKREKRAGAGKAKLTPPTCKVEKLIDRKEIKERQAAAQKQLQMGRAKMLQVGRDSRTKSERQRRKGKKENN